MKAPCLFVLLLAGAPFAGVAAAQEEPSTETQAFDFLRGEIHGRVLARGEWFDEGEITGNEYDLVDVRAELRWKPAEWLYGEFSADAASNDPLRDAYVRLRRGGWDVRLGNFKQPFSAAELESRWNLPMTERGLIRDVLVDSMGLGERRPGIQARYRRAGKRDVTLRLGVFRASHVRGDRIGDGSFRNIVRDGSVDAHKLAGRLSASFGRFDVGLFGESRPARPLPEAEYEHFWSAGADLHFSDKRKQGGRRAWLEGFVGSSWQDANAFDGAPATFVAGRFVGAWRHGGRKRGAGYVEPYVTLGLVDPDTAVREDLMWEALGGINVGSWDRFRVSIEFQHRSVGANVPLSLGLFRFDWAPPPASRTGFRVQLGGAF